MADKRANNGGARPGAGRRKGEELADLRSLLARVWTVADRETAIQAQALKANEGDTNAIKLLLSYSDGLPIQRLEHGGNANDPLRIVVEYRSQASKTSSDA